MLQLQDVWRVFWNLQKKSMQLVAFLSHSLSPLLGDFFNKWQVQHIVHWSKHLHIQFRSELAVFQPHRFHFSRHRRWVAATSRHPPWRTPSSLALPGAPHGVGHGKAMTSDFASGLGAEKLMQNQWVWEDILDKDKIKKYIIYTSIINPLNSHRLNEEKSGKRKTSKNDVVEPISCKGLYLDGLNPRRIAASMKLCTSSTSCQNGWDWKHT